MNVTISDVARIAGVSATTVSLCYREGSRISDNTRERVLQIAREIGYIPNQFAKRLRMGRSKLIALIIPEIDTPFISSIVASVEKAVSSKGYNVLVFSTFRDCKREKEAVQAARELNVEGLIVAACEKQNEDLQQVCEAQCPVVYVDSIPFDEKHCGCVINDISAVGTLGTSYLNRLGHRNILLINGPEKYKDFSSFRILEESYSNTLKENQLTPDPGLIIYEGLYINDGSNAIEKALADSLDFTAVFAISDWVALGAIECLERHGYRVPEDISVLGIDNIEIAGLDRIGLTTIETYNPHSSAETMGTAAARILLSAISSEESSMCNDQVVFKPRLVFRSSCRQIGNS